MTTAIKAKLDKSDNLINDDLWQGDSDFHYKN